jgi:hypothetical protein
MMRLFRRRESGGPSSDAAVEEPAGRGAVNSTRAEHASAEPVAAPGERPPAGRTRRRSVAWRTRDAGAAAVGAVGSGIVAIARLVTAVASLIALLIALAIVLRDVDANMGNTIVKGIHEGANLFASPFTGLIAFNGHPKRAITVDWGIALIVYLIVGAIVASFIRRIGRGGLLFERSHRIAPR